MRTPRPPEFRRLSWSRRCVVRDPVAQLNPIPGSVPPTKRGLRR